MKAVGIRFKAPVTSDVRRLSPTLPGNLSGLIMPMSICAYQNYERSQDAAPKSGKKFTEIGVVWKSLSSHGVTE